MRPRGQFCPRSKQQDDNAGPLPDEEGSERECWQAAELQFAGSCANGYRLFGEHFPSFRLLESGPAAARFAAIPLLVFAAPFIIMRNGVRGRRIERRRAQMVMVATVIAGLWSLMSGTVVVMAFEAVIRA